MNISGIRPYDGFYDYNRIAINESSQVSSQSQALEATSDSKEQAPKVSQEEIDQARSKQTFGAYDYANQYNPSASYDLKGANSDLKNLDVEKAISDMQRDQAIHQYQYFVGSDANASDSSPVRSIENFSL